MSLRLSSKRDKDQHRERACCRALIASLLPRCSALRNEENLGRGTGEDNNARDSKRPLQFLHNDYFDWLPCVAHSSNCVIELQLPTQLASSKSLEVESGEPELEIFDHKNLHLNLETVATYLRRNDDIVNTRGKVALALCHKVERLWPSKASSLSPPPCKRRKLGLTTEEPTPSHSAWSDYCFSSQADRTAPSTFTGQVSSSVVRSSIMDCEDSKEEFAAEVSTFSAAGGNDELERLKESFKKILVWEVLYSRTAKVQPLALKDRCAMGAPEDDIVRLCTKYFHIYPKDNSELAFADWILSLAQFTEALPENLKGSRIYLHQLVLKLEVIAAMYRDIPRDKFWKMPAVKDLLILAKESDNLRSEPMTDLISWLVRHPTNLVEESPYPNSFHKLVTQLESLLPLTLRSSSSDNDQLKSFLLSNLNTTSLCLSHNGRTIPLLELRKNEQNRHFLIALREMVTEALRSLDFTFRSLLSNEQADVVCEVAKDFCQTLRSFRREVYKFQKTNADLKV